jgi:hypothetical protein
LEAVVNSSSCGGLSKSRKELGVSRTVLQPAGCNALLARSLVLARNLTLLGFTSLRPLLGSKP